MKKFVSMGYYGLFIKGGQLPFVCAPVPDLCEAYKEKMEQDDFYKQFTWVVKRCVMGRHLTPHAVDAATPSEVGAVLHNQISGERGGLA